MAGKKQPTTTPVVDIDVLLAEADTSTPPQYVTMRFRGRDWKFLPGDQMNLSLFDPTLSDQDAVFLFITHMLADIDDQRDAWPNDIVLREAQAIVDGYVKAATGGLTTGE